MHSGIEGAAFDLDGTLYPNYNFNIKLLPFILKEGRLLSAFGRARNIIRKEQEAFTYKQENFYRYQAELAAKILGKSAQEIEEKIDRMIYKGWEPLFKKVKLFKGAVETLAALKKAGFKMGLLSDFPPDNKLEYLGISGFWDAALCSEKCGALKPHPSSFKVLAGAMGLPPEKILYIGNSYHYDVVGASRAGMMTAWIKNPLFPAGRRKPKADFIFNNYRQLFDFMIN